MTEADLREIPVEVRDGMRISWDVPISMSDGTVLRADVFLPEGDGSWPVVMSYGCYAKGLPFQEAYAAQFIIQDYETFRARTFEYDRHRDQLGKELERIKLRSAALIAQVESSLKTQSATLELQEKRLNELKEQLKLTRIDAPQDGLVVYASSSNPGSGILIEEGATVRQAGGFGIGI